MSRTEHPLPMPERIVSHAARRGVLATGMKDDAMQILIPEAIAR